MAKVIHFEIPVDQPDRAQAFYRDLVGWEPQGYGDMGYWLVNGAEDDPGADGALVSRGEVHQSPVLVIGVDDLDVSLARVPALGGEVLQGRMPVPGVGWSAYVKDTEGNTIGLFQPDEAAAP